MNFVITVFRTTGNEVQRYNASTLQEAYKVMHHHTRDRFVRKVELSVILMAWKRE